MSCDWNDWNNGCPPDGYPPGYTPLPPNGSYSTVPCPPYNGPPCQSIVRKNLVTFSGTFQINGAATPQPSSAAVSLYYQNMQGAFVQQAIAMTDTNGVWSANWDTSLTAGGWVQWTAFSQGAVQAATDGWFFVEANLSNVI